MLVASPDLGAAVGRVLLRLLLSIGRDVIALQAKDHYVRVHMQLGNALVLHTLSDAISDVAVSGVVG